MEEPKKLLEAYGWEEIISKNKYMRSFKKDVRRLNFYFSTGTITIQSSENWGKGEKYSDIDSLEKLEKIIS